MRVDGLLSGIGSAGVCGLPTLLTVTLASLPIQAHRGGLLVLINQKLVILPLEIGIFSNIPILKTQKDKNQSACMLLSIL